MSLVAGIRGTNDIVFVIDTSDDVSKEVITQMKSYVIAFLSSYKFNWETRVGIVSYGEKPFIQLSLLEGIKLPVVEYNLESLTSIGGKRSFNKVLVSLNEDVFIEANGARANSIKTAVIFMTGNNQEELDRDTVKLVHDNDVKLVVVAIGNEIRKHKIEEAGLKHVIHLNNSGQLPDIFSNLEDLVTSKNSKIILCFI